MQGRRRGVLVTAVLPSGHLDILQVGVHVDIHPGDGTMDGRAILQLDRDGLVGEFHQKPNRWMDG